MRKIIWTFSLCLVATSSPAATLQGYGEVEGCYLMPDTSIPTCDGSTYNLNGPGWQYAVGYDNAFVVYFCYIPSLGCNMPVVIEGFDGRDPTETGRIYEEVPEPYEGGLGYSYCRMLYPYVGYYVGYDDVGDYSEMADGNCSAIWATDVLYSCFQNEEQARDPCWEYMPRNMLVASDVNIFFESVFVPAPVPETPCSIGISRLMVSTGDAFRLWAEKYTEPSLVVQYNDEKCYVKLESGAGKLNINYNGEIYHAVE